MIRFFLLLPFNLGEYFIRFDSSKCIGVWGSSSISGDQASIEIKVDIISPSGSLGVAAYDFFDRKTIQVEELIPGYMLCTSSNGKCLPSEIGKFHLIGGNRSSVLNEAISWSPEGYTHSDNVIISNGAFKLKYDAADTGYYCVFTESEVSEDRVHYSIDLQARNSYGKLPAVFVPALAFFIAFSIIYTILGIIWLSLCFRHWKDLLPIQMYVTGVIAFLVVEMAFNYGFFADFNSNGYPSSFLLALVVLLNAGRNSISFFMILIVSLGHGVVKPSLGDKMVKCVTLAGFHFLFGAIYGTATIMSHDPNSSIIFYTTLPLALTLTAFYSWTMQGLQDTINHLKTRRQAVKLAMYNSLYYILGCSILGIFGILAANAVNLSHRENPEWIASQWKWRWMLLDGALHISYLIVFCLIAFLWMPTANNQRYGLDQIPTSDTEEFHAIIDDEDNPVKLRNLGKSDEDLLDETADEVLEWAERQFIDDDG